MHVSPFPAGPRPRAARRITLTVLSTALVLGAPLAAQQGAGGVEVTRKALEDWTETRRILSREGQQWRLARQTMESRLAVVRRELGSLSTRIDEAQKSVAEADQKRVGMVGEKEQLDAVAGDLKTRVAALEARLRSMLPRLPDPLRDGIKLLTQSLPENEEQAAQKKLSLGQRYQNVIGALDAITKWNREVTFKTEVRQQTNGQNVEVSVIYLGLGQAYYAGAVDQHGKATVGGLGVATATGWVWKPANELAPAIQQAISIYKNEQLAALVRLPVQIL